MVIRRCRSALKCIRLGEVAALALVAVAVWALIAWSHAPSDWLVAFLVAVGMGILEPERIKSVLASLASVLGRRTSRPPS